MGTCVHTNVCISVCVHTYARQRLTSGVFRDCFPLSGFEAGLSLKLALTACLDWNSLEESTCFSQIPIPVLELHTQASMPNCYVDAGDLNQGPHGGTTNT